MIFPNKYVVVVVVVAHLLFIPLYTKRTKVFVHHQISMYRLCHLSTKESVGNQDEN